MRARAAAASVGTRPAATRLITWPKAAMLEAESWQACQWVKRLPEGPAPLLRGAFRSAVAKSRAGTSSSLEWSVGSKPRSAARVTKRLWSSSRTSGEGAATLAWPRSCAALPRSPKLTLRITSPASAFPAKPVEAAAPARRVLAAVASACASSRSPSQSPRTARPNRSKTSSC